MNSVRAAGVNWLAGAAVYLVGEAVSATGVDGYSYLADYISDLGVSGLMNRTFMVHGALFLVGAILATRGVPAGWIGRAFAISAALNALGNIGVGGFQSGATAHVVGAGLAIIGGNVAVVLGGLGSRSLGAPRMFRAVSVALGAFGLVCLAVLVVDGADGATLPVGLVERGAVYPIIAWEVMAGVALLWPRRSVA